MTYNVQMGTLNHTLSLTHSLTHSPQTGILTVMLSLGLGLVPPGLVC